MFDTITVLAYLLRHDSRMSNNLQLQAFFSEKQNTAYVQSIVSPKIKWHGVPPEAESLAVVVKDASIELKNEKQNYYWVVYNLPVQATQLNFGEDKKINPYDEGLNSWGAKNYHTTYFEHKTHPVVVELFVLDKRFSAQNPITGDVLEKKIQGHVIAKSMILKV